MWLLICEWYVKEGGEPNMVVGWNQTSKPCPSEWPLVSDIHFIKAMF